MSPEASLCRRASRLQVSTKKAPPSELWWWEEDLAGGQVEVGRGQVLRPAGPRFKGESGGQGAARKGILGQQSVCGQQ